VFVLEDVVSVFYEKYAVECKKVISDYLQGATRYGAENLKISDAKPWICGFDVKVRYAEEVVSESRECAGKVAAGRGDIAFTRLPELKEAASAQLEEELARKETLDELTLRLTAAPYASISERTIIRENPRQFFHRHKCADCGGRGSNPCNKCGGRGKVSCSFCWGSGKSTCSTCNGSGYVSASIMNYSTNKTEMSWRNCCNCSGGHVSCWSCGGSGSKSCGNCKGSGRIACSPCNGTGWKTTVVKTAVYTTPVFDARYAEGTPDYVHSALDKARFARLDSIGLTEYDSYEKDYDNLAVSLLYRCSAPFCELSVRFSNDRSEWTLFGGNPEIYDAGNALDKILESDLSQIYALSEDGKIFKPFFPFAASKKVQLFMKSKVNRDLFQAAASDDSAEGLYDAINRSVSVSYIERALCAMNSFVRLSMFWLKTECFLLLSCAAILFPLLWHAWHDTEQPLRFLPDQMRSVIFSAQGSFAWSLAFFSLMFTFIAGLAAKLIIHMWLRRVGGKPLFNWAREKGVLLTRKTLVLFMLGGFIATGWFYGKFDVWADRSGRVYGVLPLYEVKVKEPDVKTPQPQTKKDAEQKPL